MPRRDLTENIKIAYQTLLEASTEDTSGRRQVIGVNRILMSLVNDKGTAISIFKALRSNGVLIKTGHKTTYQSRQVGVYLVKEIETEKVEPSEPETGYNDLAKLFASSPELAREIVEEIWLRTITLKEKTEKEATDLQEEIKTACQRLDERESKVAGLSKKIVAIEALRSRL